MLEMWYELCIACSSVAISFLVYFNWNWWFGGEQRDKLDNYSDNDYDDDNVVFDKRPDLDGKELLFVSLVRQFEHRHRHTHKSNSGRFIYS